MKKFFLLLIVISSGFTGLSQTYIYKTERMYFNEMLCNVNDGYVLPENSNMWSDAVYTARNNKIFEGFSTSTFDILYTISEDHLFIGDSNFSFDIVYTIKNGRVYKGDSTMMLDCLYTYDIKTNRIYTGDSTFSLDAVLFLQGEALNSEELFAVLISQKML